MDGVVGSVTDSGEARPSYTSLMAAYRERLGMSSASSSLATSIIEAPSVCALLGNLNWCQGIDSFWYCAVYGLSTPLHCLIVLNGLQQGQLYTCSLQRADVGSFTDIVLCMYLEWDFVPQQQWTRTISLHASL